MINQENPKIKKILIQTNTHKNQKPPQPTR